MIGSSKTTILDWFEKNWIKILAALILFGGIGRQPYSYYELIRWATCAAALYTAYNFHKEKNIFWMWIFVAFGILFNPIAPFYLARDTWQNLDIIAALVFIIPTFFKVSRQESVSPISTLVRERKQKDILEVAVFVAVIIIYCLIVWR